MSPNNYLVLSALLFSIGAIGVVLRRNAIVVFMCVELMLNGAGLSIVAAAQLSGKEPALGYAAVGLAFQQHPHTQKPAPRHRDDARHRRGGDMESHQQKVTREPAGGGAGIHPQIVEHKQHHQRAEVTQVRGFAKDAVLVVQIRHQQHPYANKQAAPRTVAAPQQHENEREHRGHVTHRHVMLDQGCTVDVGSVQQGVNHFGNLQHYQIAEDAVVRADGLDRVEEADAPHLRQPFAALGGVGTAKPGRQGAEVDEGPEKGQHQQSGTILHVKPTMIPGTDSRSTGGHVGRTG